MIPQRNLSLLSNRLAKDGGRRIPEAVLERDYCLAWLLAVLSKEKLGDVRGELAAKEARFKKLWQTRLAAQMASLPEFEEVYRSVRRAFRQADLA